MDIILEPANMYFVAALGLMLGLGLIEALALLVGLFSFSGWIDEVCLHHDTAETDGLSWLFIGKLPFLIILVILLTVFGLSGIVTQLVAQQWTGAYLPAWQAIPLPLMLSILAVRGLGGLFLKYLPQAETTAISLDELVGYVGTVVTGTARVGYPAPAKTRDRHGKTHYIRVEPEHPEQVFTEKTEILLVRRKEGNRFIAVANPCDQSTP